MVNRTAIAMLESSLHARDDAKRVDGLGTLVASAEVMDVLWHSSGHIEKVLVCVRTL